PSPGSQTQRRSPSPPASRSSSASFAAAPRAAPARRRRNRPRNPTRSRARNLRGLLPHRHARRSLAAAPPSPSSARTPPRARSTAAADPASDRIVCTFRPKIRVLGRKLRTIARRSAQLGAAHPVGPHRLRATRYSWRNPSSGTDLPRRRRMSTPRPTTRHYAMDPLPKPLSSLPPSDRGRGLALAFVLAGLFGAAASGSLFLGFVRDQLHYQCSVAPGVAIGYVCPQGLAYFPYGAWVFVAYAVVVIIGSVLLAPPVRRSRLRRIRAQLLAVVALLPNAIFVYAVRYVNPSTTD